ncbi:hypothetical protein B2J93_7755 [Marssonina coronariae]|uniref:Uncharacterized protein n=1 Tax=Diplocarpon coronariae TaxID=2795749 RepID=A0A218ZG07_9HELO|nr:hypothetical protein B2J93_7755 [Marssonina coronariae]
MLRHVYNCPHLSKGLYWCFHCQKPERVGKFQCKRCQGNTSGKGLFASVAKKIFSKLGAKPHRFDHAATTGASENLTNRYLDFDVEESSVMASFQDRFQQDRRMKWCLPDAQELPSTSVIPEMAGDWKAASHELADTCISEMLGAGCPVELGAGLENWEDNFYAESFEEFDVASEPVKTRVSSPKLARLDTSVAQTALCSNWPDTPRSTTIISPMSAIMRSDSTRSAIEISPTDSEASGNSFFTDSAYSRATTHSATFSNGSIKRFPSIGNIGDKKGTKDGDFCLVSEESINSTPGSVPPPLPEEGAPLKRNILQKAQVNSTAEHSAGRFTGSSEPKLPSPNWDDATSLVRSFSEALDSHIQHSKATLQALSPTPTVRELLSVPRSSMISTGLEVLANLLAGRHPTSTIQVFSFTHVACALAIAVDDGDVRAHTEKWLRNTLIYASGLQGERHKKGYEQVAKAIWEPSGSSVSNDLLSDSSRSIESLQPTTCKHFLDIFETLHSSTPGDLPVSHHFDSAQASSEHKVKACIIERLTNSPKIEDFTEYVGSFERRPSQIRISNDDLPLLNVDVESYLDVEKRQKRGLAAFNNAIFTANINTSTRHANFKVRENLKTRAKITSNSQKFVFILPQPFTSSFPSQLLVTTSSSISPIYPARRYHCRLASYQNAKRSGNYPTYDATSVSPCRPNIV